MTHVREVNPDISNFMFVEFASHVFMTGGLFSPCNQIQSGYFVKQF